jgi:hypothetical protein
MQSRLNHPSFWRKSTNANIEKENISDETHVTEAAVSKSGNSDVDVNVKIDIDTMPIALAVLCLSLANKQLTKEEFEEATRKLFELNDKYIKDRKSNVKYFNENIWRR